MVEHVDGKRIRRGDEADGVVARSDGRSGKRYQRSGLKVSGKLRHAAALAILRSGCYIDVCYGVVAGAGRKAQTHRQRHHCGCCTAAYPVQTHVLPSSRELCYPINSVYSHLDRNSFYCDGIAGTVTKQVGRALAVKG